MTMNHHDRFDPSILCHDQKIYLCSELLTRWRRSWSCTGPEVAGRVGWLSTSYQQDMHSFACHLYSTKVIQVGIGFDLDRRQPHLLLIPMISTCYGPTRTAQLSPGPRPPCSLVPGRGRQCSSTRQDVISGQRGCSCWASVVGSVERRTLGQAYIWTGSSPSSTPTAIQLPPDDIINTQWSKGANAQRPNGRTTTEWGSLANCIANSTRGM